MPFEVSNIDQSILKWQQIIREGLKPRIFGIDFNPVRSGEKWLLVVNINKSLAAPHMVADKTFYYRTSASKQQMEVEDLRTVFLSTASFAEKVENWRQNQLNDMAVTHAEPTIIVHCIPLGFGPEYKLDAATLGKQANLLQPFGLPDIFKRIYNLQGFLVSTATRVAGMNNTVQFYRSGQIESKSYFIRTAEGKIPGVLIEREVMVAVSNYLNAMKNVEISPPIAIGVSFKFFAGLTLDVHNNSIYPSPTSFSDNLFMLPSVVLEEWPTSSDDIERVMKPAFDALWNAGGAPYSPHFSEHGKFILAWTFS